MYLPEGPRKHAAYVCVCQTTAVCPTPRSNRVLPVLPVLLSAPVVSQQPESSSEVKLRGIGLLQEEYERGSKVGLDISTGDPLDPQMAGIFDNYLVKKQVIQSAPVIASQLLLVDEVMRAGVGMRGK